MLAAAPPSLPIAPGVSLPYVSLGTGSGIHHPGVNVTDAVTMWLRAGGAAIDTAYDYGTQRLIAKGVAAAGPATTAPFLTTKVPSSSYEKAAAHIDADLSELGVAAVDLLLIHFPSLRMESTYDTWRALEDAYLAGKARAIGVSNFQAKHFEAMRVRKPRVWPPALNQGSLSVGYRDEATLAYCSRAGIGYMAYSPLCGGPNGSSCRHGSVLAIPEVKAVAAAHGVSAAQVALRWIVQQKRPLATAVWRADFMREDLDLWSWGELSDAEMGALSAVHGRAYAAARRD